MLFRRFYYSCAVVAFQLFFYTNLWRLGIACLASLSHSRLYTTRTLPWRRSTRLRTSSIGCWSRHRSRCNLMGTRFYRLFIIGSHASVERLRVLAFRLLFLKPWWSNSLLNSCFSKHFSRGFIKDLFYTRVVLVLLRHHSEKDKTLPFWRLLSWLYHYLLVSLCLVLHIHSYSSRRWWHVPIMGLLTRMHVL